MEVHMEKQRDAVQLENQIGKPIMAMKIFRTAQTAVEKELIKEFFRFVGCLVIDTPMTLNEIKSYEFSNQEKEKTQTIFLFLSEELPDEFDQISLTGKLWVTFNINKRLFAINQANERLSLEKCISVENFEKRALDLLIDNIWQYDSTNKESLKKINDIYWKHHLFAYLQIKRTYRVVNMGEVLALGARHYDIPDDNFILNMVSELATASRESKENVYPTSVYSIYAYVNGERKIREICNCLDQNSHLRTKISANIPSVTSLLQELHHIYKISPRYMAMYYLAAYLCQSDSQHTLNAYEYFLDARRVETNGMDEFSAFGVYQLGRYTRKIQNNPDCAFEYYAKAAETNNRCYQAVFQMACYYVHKKEYEKARKMFLAVIDIIGTGLELVDLPYSDKEMPDLNDWKYLSLKETQYVFKAYIWLAKLALFSSGESAIGVFVRGALSAAIAYMYCPMLEKSCDEDVLKTVRIYHRRGMPVKALFIVLRDMVGNSSANVDLRIVIETINERLELNQI